MKFRIIGVVVALVLAAIAASVWYAQGLNRTNESTSLPNRKEPTAHLSTATLQQSLASPVANRSLDIKSLAARCQTAMIKDVCGVMTASKPSGNQSGAERLFIAGVGEVDAAVFNRLREAGDKMCGEVETECVANWVGSSCKIARALYPPS